MSKLPIVSIPDKILRQRTRPVTRFDGELQQLIDNMIETLREANGVGLAAPQVGRPCLLYTSDAADERSSVDLGGRRFIKQKKQKKKTGERISLLNI